MLIPFLTGMSFGACQLRERKIYRASCRGKQLGSFLGEPQSLIIGVYLNLSSGKEHFLDLPFFCTFLHKFSHQSQDSGTTENNTHFFTLKRDAECQGAALFLAPSSHKLV